jgi:hypothetical protein
VATGTTGVCCRQDRDLRRVERIGGADGAKYRRKIRAADDAVSDLGKHRQIARWRQRRLAADKDKQKAAWEYVKFATGPIGQTIMASGTGYAPGNRKATDEPSLLGGYYQARPNLATGVNQLPLMTGWYNWAGPNAVKIVDVIQIHINDVATGRKTAAEAMPRMKRDVDAMLPANCP